MIFEVNGLKLVGNYKKGIHGKPQIFIIHGGGLQPDQAGRFLEWQDILAESEFSSFVFNHSGILPSEGDVKDTTLELRLLEARSALEVFLKLSGVKSSNLIVVGISMGGHIAVQLTAEVQSHGLILCEPGSFVEEAENKTFGPFFTKALRQEQNWETVSTRSFVCIRKYNGNLLIIVPENDTVVPRAVPQRYFNEAKNAQTKELYMLKGATHFYFRLNDPTVDPKWRNDFYKKTLNWIRSLC